MSGLMLLDLNWIYKWVHMICACVRVYVYQINTTLNKLYMNVVAWMLHILISENQVLQMLYRV